MRRRFAVALGQLHMPITRSKHSHLTQAAFWISLISVLLALIPLFVYAGIHLPHASRVSSDQLLLAWCCLIANTFALAPLAVVVAMIGVTYTLTHRSESCGLARLMLSLGIALLTGGGGYWMLTVLFEELWAI